MKKQIDCFLIGPNESKIDTYEMMNNKTEDSYSPAYKDLLLNTICYQKIRYRAPEIIKKLIYKNSNKQKITGSFSINSFLSAAIAQIASSLEKNGLTFDYINSFQHEKSILAKKLQSINILTIAVTTTLYISVHPILEIISFIRKYNNSVKIIVGGPFILSQNLYYKESTLRSLYKYIGADFYIISRQGEDILVKIIKAIKNNKSFYNIHNISYKNKTNYIFNDFLKEKTKLSRNLTNWKLFQFRLNKFISIRTAVSCPFSCSFCEDPVRLGAYKTLPIEDIKYNLNQISKIKSVESIRFIDDTFNVPRSRFKKILKMMIKEKYNFKWHSFLRCQYIDNEVVELMKDSGCEGVYLGIESGNTNILQMMNKKVNINDLYRGVELLNKYEIFSIASFIIGFPGETESSINDTIDFIEKSKPTFYILHLWFCSSLVPIWKDRIKYNISYSGKHWSHNTMNSFIALEWIDKMFMLIKNSIRTPFHFDDIIYLLHQGMSINQVKNFCINFNSIVKNQLNGNKHKNIMSNNIHNLKKSITNLNLNASYKFH